MLSIGISLSTMREGRSGAGTHGSPRSAQRSVSSPGDAMVDLVSGEPRELGLAVHDEQAGKLLSVNE